MQDKDQPLTIAAAAALSCIGVFGIFTSLIFVSTLGAVLGMSPAEASQVPAAEKLGTALATLVAIAWIRRFDWRRMSAIAILIVLVVNIASAYAQDATTLTALRFIAGFAGQGTVFAIGIAIINDTANHDRNFAFVIAAQVATGILTLLVLPPLAKSYGVAGIVWPLALLAVLVLPLLLRVPAHPKPRTAEQGARASNASLVPALVALVVMLIWCTGLGAVWGFVMKIGTASEFLDMTLAGRALAISTLAGVGGALAASWLADRAGRILPVTVGLLVQAIAISALRGDMSFVQFAATCAVFQIFWNFTGPYLMGTVAAADYTGRMSVTIPAAQIGGFAGGLFLAGRLMSPDAPDALLVANYVGIAGCTIALLLFIPLALQLRRKAQTAIA